MTVIASSNSVAVYPFRLYDITQDEYVLSKRLARMATIQKLGAVQAGPSFSVPYEDVDQDGFTVKGYDGYQAERNSR